MTNGPYYRGKAQTTSLRDRTLTGIGWKATSSLTYFISQFAIGVVLARLLPPRDFGLLGLAMIVVGFGTLFVDLGFGPALIQRQSLTERHIRVAFTISIFTSLTLGMLVYILAPFAAEFFRDTRVVTVLHLLSLTFIFAGFSVVSNALLIRKLAFRRLFFVEITSGGVIYGFIAISLALAGFGIWSLVAAGLARSFMRCLLLYYVERHTVVPLVASAELKELTGFSAGLTLARLCNYFALKGDYLIVGRILGPEVLGIYTRAYNLMTLPTTFLAQIIGSVLFPVASKLQADAERFRSLYLDFLSLVGFISMPLSALLVILGPEIIVGIYGRNWAGAIVPLQILGLFTFFRAHYSAAATFLRAKGWVYRIMLCQIVYGVTVVSGSVLAATLWGINGVASAVGLAILIMWSLVIQFSKKATGASTADVLATVVPGVVFAVPVVLVTVCLKSTFLYFGVKPLWVVINTLVASSVPVTASLFLIPQRFLGFLPHRILENLEGVIPSWLRPAYCRIVPQLAGNG